MPRESPSKGKSGSPKALTSIGKSIHCAATSVDADSYVNEQDQIDIDNFLGALADVARAVAARRLAPIPGDREPLDQ